MENDIPKIDLPDDWIIGNLSHKDIGLLSLYANYPCRLVSQERFKLPKEMVFPGWIG